MKKLSPKAILVPAMLLFLICLIIASLLGVTNALTKEPIAQQAALKAEEARKVVLADAQSFEQFDTGDPSDDCYLAFDKDKNLIGCTVTTSKKGYGGDVQVMTGFHIGGETAISGVAILSQSETPGLGANAVNPDFTNQFKQPLPEDGFSVIKNGTPKDGEIAAMTGATITSKAVSGAVNDAFKVVNKVTTAIADGKIEGGVN